jgi:hypothetical protein
MDTRGSAVLKSAGMDDHEPAPAGADREECACDPCPSYNECMRAGGQLLFCREGRSKDCVFDPKGCLCPSCPVARRLGLKKAYFCIRGSADEQA